MESEEWISHWVEMLQSSCVGNMQAKKIIICYQQYFKGKSMYANIFSTLCATSLVTFRDSLDNLMEMCNCCWTIIRPSLLAALQFSHYTINVWIDYQDCTLLFSLFIFTLETSQVVGMLSAFWLFFLCHNNWQRFGRLSAQYAAMTGFAF